MLKHHARIETQTAEQAHQRIIRLKNPAKLSAVRLIVAGKSGATHLFNLYTYAPFFDEPFPRHLFSPCGRFTAFPIKTEIDGEKMTTPGQYHVYYNGNPVPEDRYSFRLNQREKQYRAPSAYKHTRGRAV